METEKITDRHLEKYFPLIQSIINKKKDLWDLCEAVWEDIFADLCSSLFRAKLNYNPNHDSKSKFITHANKYITTEINTILRSMARYKKRHKPILDYDLENSGYGITPIETTLPLEKLERKEIREILLRALGSLRPLDAEIVREYYYEDKSDNQIKKDLGVEFSRAAVSFRRHESLKKLRKTLWEDYVESDLL